MSIVRSRGKGMKPTRAARKLNTAAMRVALADGKFWSGLGIVYHPNGEPKHYEVDGDIGVLVHVQLMPSNEPIMARLGGLGEGGANGVWRVPPVGSEVALLIPGGELEAGPLLVGVLASGGTPGELDEDTLVVKAPKVVIIADGAVEVGEKGLGPTDGVVHGQGVDAFTGMTYTAMGNTSSTLKAKK